MKSTVLISVGGIEEAIEVLELGVIKSKQVGYRKFTVDAYEKLAELYNQLGNYKKAYLSLKEYKKYKTEVEDAATTKKIEEFQILYESKQKDKEIENLATQNNLKEEANKNLLAKQEAEKSTSRIIYIALGSGVVLLGLIGGLLFMAAQRRKKANDFLIFTNDKIKSQSKQIEDSIAYARNIQNAILPLDSELSRSLSEHFVYYKPKDIVSGDFYWYNELKENNKILVAVADCIGHGVPGAFMSIVGHALLEKIVMQLGIKEPNEILNQLGIELNNTLQKGNHSKVNDGMDIALISIDLKNNYLEYSGARNQLIFISDGKLTEFKGDRIDLGKGKVAEKKFTKYQVSYAKGDCFYMFTDGYVDQKGGLQGKKYFMPPFRELLKEISVLSIDEQKEILNTKFQEWKGDSFEQMDDVLVIGGRL
jgi:serine phosphatase RsbU (regulator of sigma subunit)